MIHWDAIAVFSEYDTHDLRIFSNTQCSEFSRQKSIFICDHKSLTELLRNVFGDQKKNEFRFLFSYFYDTLQNEM